MILVFYRRVETTLAKMYTNVTKKQTNRFGFKPCVDRCFHSVSSRALPRDMIYIYKRVRVRRDKCFRGRENGFL